MTNGSHLTCGTCRHWHKLPPNPQDLTQRNGECHHSPPCVVVLPTPHGAMIAPRFPMLNSEQVACGQHAPQPIALDSSRL